MLRPTLAAMRTTEEATTRCLVERIHGSVHGQDIIIMCVWLHLFRKCEAFIIERRNMEIKMVSTIIHSSITCIHHMHPSHASITCIYNMHLYVRLRDWACILAVRIGVLASSVNKKKMETK